MIIYIKGLGPSVWYMHIRGTGSEEHWLQRQAGLGYDSGHSTLWNPTASFVKQK